MCANARRLCLSVAAVAIFAITFPRASEAGTISLDTAFLGSAVGYELESAIPAFQIHAFAIDGLGSVRMSQAAGVDGIGFAEVFEAFTCVDILGPIFDNFSPTANPPVEVTAFGDPMTTWSDPYGVPVPLGNAAGCSGGGLIVYKPVQSPHRGLGIGRRLLLRRNQHNGRRRTDRAGHEHLEHALRCGRQRLIRRRHFLCLVRSDEPWFHRMWPDNAGREHRLARECLYGRACNRFNRRDVDSTDQPRGKRYGYSGFRGTGSGGIAAAGSRAIFARASRHRPDRHCGCETARSLANISRGHLKSPRMLSHARAFFVSACFLKAQSSLLRYGGNDDVGEPGDPGGPVGDDVRPRRAARNRRRQRAVDVVDGAETD